jgi:serine/threonine-protein kinase
LVYDINFKDIAYFWGVILDNDRYKYDIDFSYLGDFLLYLLYSTYTAQKKKRLPWYQELPLSPEQKTFLKKLLRLENSYESIDEVKKDFIEAFCISEN